MIYFVDLSNEKISAKANVSGGLYWCSSTMNSSKEILYTLTLVSNKAFSSCHPQFAQHEKGLYQDEPYGKLGKAWTEKSVTSNWTNTACWWLEAFTKKDNCAAKLLCSFLVLILKHLNSWWEEGGERSPQWSHPLITSPSILSSSEIGNDCLNNTPRVLNT